MPSFTTPDRMSRRRRGTTVACLLLAVGTACVESPVEWEQARLVADGDSAALAADVRIGIDSAGAVTLVPGVATPSTLPGDSARCTASLRVAAAAAGADAKPGRIDAVWWSVRRDSSAVLRASISRDGGLRWSAPATVDSVDRSTVGCSRPAPSITHVGRDAYVAYSMRAPEGTGIFFSHSMDMPRLEGVYHAPVPVIYGDRLVPVAVAADGGITAVAFEDPSGSMRRIGLSFSRTQGHTFERYHVASPSAVQATKPDLAVRGASIALSWSAGASRVVRMGRIREP